MYYGLFFNKQLFQPDLSRAINKPHVTFCFEKGDTLELPEELSDMTASVTVIGYGNDGENEGYLVKLNDPNLLRFYKGAKQMHITISLSNTGKAVSTASLLFKSIPQFTLTGKFGIEKF
jgi:hypothetical protein